MAVSHAQATATANVAGVSTSLNVVLTNNPANGDLVCVGVQYFNGTGTPPASLTVADANGNNYTKSTNSPSSAQATACGFAYAFYLNNASNASKTITITYSSPGAGGSVEGFADDFTVSGGTTTFSSDTVGSGSAGSTVNTPTVVVAGTTDLVFGFATVSGTISNSGVSPWTQGAIGGNGNATGYILSRSGNVAFNWPQSGTNWDSIGLDFTFAVTATGVSIMWVKG